MASDRCDLGGKPQRGGRHVQRATGDAREVPAVLRDGRSRRPRGLAWIPGRADFPRRLAPAEAALMDDQADIPIVEAKGLDKTYDTGAIQVHALKGVDLAIQRGEMVSIMGPSGCGKTTLLNCLSGLDSIDEGEVVIDGACLSELSDRERTDYRARRMGFVFQVYNLLPVLSGVENVELPLLVAGVKPKEARA